MNKSLLLWLALPLAGSLVGCEAERGREPAIDLSDEAKSGGMAVVCYPTDIGGLSAFASPEL
ncbi:MAG: hypothetical protein PVJ64_15990, partial [Gemmatimonadales bacterium]